MDPNCYCKRCFERMSVGMPSIHLKSYDDTIEESPLRPPPSGHEHKLHCIPSKADCGCEICLARLAEGKLPAHLKKFDDTVQEPDCNEFCNTNRCDRNCGCQRCVIEGLVPPRPIALDVSESGSQVGSEDEEDSDEEDYEVPRYRLDYEMCTPQELKRFIQDKGLPDPFPAGLTLKCYYLPILGTADQIASFRFLDLPPETRNLVYNELLIMPCRTVPPHKRASHKDHCYPQILPANKEINNDAKGILYTENTLMAYFACSRAGYGDDTRIVLHNAAYHNPSSLVRKVNGNDIVKLCALPIVSHFNKIHALHIDISLDQFEYGVIQDGVLQNALFIFASSLMGAHSLTDIKIHFSSKWGTEPFEEGELAENILYPLRRLRDIAHVEVTGDLTDELVQSIKSEIQGSQPALETWNYIQFTLDECALRFELMERCGFEEISWGWDLMHELWSTWRLLHQITSDPQKPLCANAKEEADLRRKMDELHDMIPSYAFLKDLLAFHSWRR